MQTGYKKKEESHREATKRELNGTIGQTKKGVQGREMALTKTTASATPKRGSLAFQ
jgi:hypothetical protein